MLENTKVVLDEMISLHDVENMRKVLENHGVTGATDKEIKAAYEVYEGHGHELFIKDLKDYAILKVDTCDNDSEIDTTDLATIISDSWCMLNELVEEFYEEFDTNIKEDDRQYHEALLMARRLTSDLYSRLLDMKGNYLYIISVVKDSMFNAFDKERYIETFKTEMDAYNYIEGLLKDMLKEEDIENISDQGFINFDLNNELHKKIYLGEFREKDDFEIVSRECSLRVNLDKKFISKDDDKEEEKTVDQNEMEFYCVTEFSQEYDTSDTFLDTRHYRTREEAEENFKQVVEDFKSEHVHGEIGAYDSLDETNSEDNKYFSLYVDCGIRVECAFEKVVL